MTPVRRLAPMAALLTLVSVACGGGTQILATAAGTTTETGSSRLAMTMSASDGSGGRSFTVRAEGLIDYRTGHGALTMDLSEVGLPMGGDATVEMRLLGGAAYLRMPGAELGGRPWLRIDLEGAGASANPIPGLDASSGDPRGVLDALRGVTGEVEDLGEENVRGEPARHYRASVSLAAAEEEVPAERQDDFAEFRDRLGRDTLPIDVWVDSEGRVRKLAYSVDTAAMAQSPARPGEADGVAPASGTIDLSIELFDFGVRVDVETPPPSEVTDYGALDAAA